MPYLSNPLGLWALAAIPAILIIHTLQERSRRVRASTLFLLDYAQPLSTGGVRWERLRQSLPMWLQILAALMLAWVLTEPRWISTQSRQTVVVVLDSSASMSAFRDKLSPVLSGTLSRWERIATKTDWHLLQSDHRQPTLYAGKDLPKLLAAIKDWQPLLGTHDSSDVLNQARGLVKDHGAVLFVSDQPANLPAGIGLLSIGEEVDNVGWTGVEIIPGESPNAPSKWRATIHGYSPIPSQREWWISLPEAGKTMPHQVIRINPGQTLILEGPLPAGVSSATLNLDADSFTWDDTLPFVIPKQQIVTVDFRLSEAPGAVLKRMIEAIQGVQIQTDATQPADLTIAEIGTATPGHAILTLTDTEAELSGDWTIAEDHPLTKDLHWMGLLTPIPPALFVSDTDQPLLWKKDRVLALIRHGESESDGRPTQRLMLNWNLANSNAARLPSMLILLQRFVHEIRQTKTAPWAANFETRQAIPLPPSTPGKPQKATVDAPTSPFSGRAPDRPGFFSVQLDGQPWLTAAASFADTREADFSKAAPADTTESLRLKSAVQQTEADPLTALYVLAALASLLLSWAIKTSRPAPPPPTFLHPVHVQE
ncbi:MAG: BatA domain-containing protein [Verrucomicrobiaceae bacterium]|nr:BatA domain-containing protein [Verrucomicrobiaceae bacterium]